MPDISEQVEALYSRMFEKYYASDDLPTWTAKSFFGGGTSGLYKSFIRTCLEEGYKVKTGYKTSKKVTGHKTHYVFYKK